MSMKKVLPITPDLLVSFYDIYVLLNKYKHDDGPWIAIGEDSTTGEVIEASQASIDFQYAICNKLLWGEVTCYDQRKPSGELIEKYFHHVDYEEGGFEYYIGPRLPIEDLLVLLGKDLAIKCWLHFKNHTDEIKSMPKISKLLSEYKNDRTPDLVRKLQSEGNIQFNLSEGWELLQILFDVRPYRIRGAAIDGDSYTPFESNFLTIDFLQSKDHLLPKIEKYLRIYTDAFIMSGIDWGSANIYKYEKQAERLNREFREHEDNFGNTFWIDLNVYEHDSKYKRIETIIAQAVRGQIEILDMKVETGRTGCKLIANVLVVDPTRKNKGQTNEDEQNRGDMFRYGNSITDCDAHYIWKDGDKKNGQTFTKGKRRYIWEYCRAICGQGFKKQEDMNKFVSERLGRNERVTVDDMKGLLGIIAMYSDIPLKELNKERIIFKSGKGIEVKKVPL